MSRASAGPALAAAHPDIKLRADQKEAQADKDGTDRPRHEYGKVAARDQHGAAEILLEARSKHEAEQDRRGVEAEAQQEIAEGADHYDFANLEEIVVGGVHADTDEEHRARVEEAIRDRQHLHPHADQRHVEQYEQDVADPEAGNQTPEDIGMLGNELRSGHDALDHQGAEQERHDRVARNAQTHRGDEIALDRGVGRGLWTDHALDKASTEFLLIYPEKPRKLLYSGVGDEGRYRRSGAGNERAQTAGDSAKEHRADRPSKFSLGRPHVFEADIGVSGVDGRNLIDAVHELGDAEQAERQRARFDTVVELGHAEGEALRPGFKVGADGAEKESEHGHGHAFERRSTRQRRAGQQAKQHERADLGRAELQRRPHQQR